MGNCPLSTPAQTLLPECGVSGSGLRETSFLGFLLSSLAFTTQGHYAAQVLKFRRCLGPPGPSDPSAAVCSRTTACPFGLACIFHMCCPGQFPSSVKSFSSSRKFNGGNKHKTKTRTVQVHEFMLDGSEGSKVDSNLENFNSQSISRLT